MAGIIFTLCAMTSFMCAWLLLLAYFRSRYRLLLWGGLCFSALTVNNILVIFDKMIVTTSDLSTVRLVAALIGMLILLYGLIFDTD